MLIAIALFVAVLVCIRILSEINRLCTRKPFVWITNNGTCWAVVTGAGSGIGYEFSRQLALKGYNLLLISLFEHELEEAKTKILQEVKLTNPIANIQIRTLAIDFSRLDIYDQIEKFLNLDNLDIFVAVNNVGTAKDLPAYFLSGDYSTRNQAMINVNLVAMTRIIELVLPSMVRKQRGLIINMSSGSCPYPCPLLSVYTATKCYVKKLSECLAEEYRQSNVNIISLGPLWISTGMTHNVKPNMFIISAQDYVEKVLRSIKYHEYFDCQIMWPHKMQHYAMLSIEWIFTPQLFAQFQHWLLRRISALAKRLKAWHAKSPNQPPSQWQQVKYFFLSE